MFTDLTFRRTKILITLGPSTEDKKIMRELIENGADGLRLNYSHGSIEYFSEIIDKISEVEEELGVNIPIMGDLQGPTVRLGETEKVKLTEGKEVEIVFAERSEKPGKVIPVPEETVIEVMEPGDIFFIDDGKVLIKIKEKRGNRVIGVVGRGGEIRSHVTVSVKGKEPDLPILSKRDIEFIDLTVRRKLSYIALSFVRSEKDVIDLKKTLRQKGGGAIEIVSKVETMSAIENLDSIIKASDWILIARGDLGMHYNLEEIPILQRIISEKCLKFGRPSILATQILESMIWNPIPTRSEVSDIHVGVMEGVSAMMLSGETAIGRYPKEAVMWLRKTIEEAEKNYSPPRITGYEETIYDKFALGTVLLAEKMSAKILAYTKEGQTAKRLSRYRPRSPIYVFTTNKNVARKIKLLWGIKPIIVHTDNIEEAIEEGKAILISRKILKKGDVLIKTSGLRRLATDRLEVEILE